MNRVGGVEGRERNMISAAKHPRFHWMQK